MKTHEIHEEMINLWNDYIVNHTVNQDSGNKSAGVRARKALNELKKLITPYKKASMEESKK